MKIFILNLFLSFYFSSIICGQSISDFKITKIEFQGKKIYLVNYIMDIESPCLHANKFLVSKSLITFYFPTNIDVDLKKKEILQIFKQDSLKYLFHESNFNNLATVEYLKRKVKNSIFNPTVYFFAKENTKYDLLSIDNDMIWFSMPLIDKKMLEIIDQITIGGRMDFLIGKNLLIKKSENKYFFRKFPNCISCDFSGKLNDTTSFNILEGFEKCIMVINKYNGIENLIEYQKIPISN